MTTLREAAQQALEALEKTHTQPGCEQWQAERKASVALRAAQEEQEQEPVAWIESPHGAIRANPLYRITAPQSVAWSIPLYAHPPRREWQSLSDEEIDVVAFALGFEQLTPRSVARAIEAKLKEKNNG